MDGETRGILAGSGDESEPLLSSSAATDGRPDGRPLVSAAEIKRFRRSVRIQYGCQVLNEFSVWGFLTILALYCNDFLKLSENKSTTVVFLAMTMYNAISPLGAYAADYWWGNYKTQMICYCFWTLGMLLCWLPTLPEVTAISEPYTGKLVMSFTGIALVVMSYGTVDPIFPVFIADQFPPGFEAEMSASFSWYYFYGTVGSSVASVTATILRQYVNPFAAVTMLAVAIVLAFWLFAAGTKTYNRVPPKPKPLVAPTFAERWAGVRATYVEIKPLLKILAPMVIFWGLVYLQMSIYVFTATNMNLTVKGTITIPADMISSFDDVFVMIHIGYLEYIVYPLMRRWRGAAPSPLNRIAFGFLPMAVSLLYAGFLEAEINRRPANTISWAWQLPVYWFNSLGEVLVSVSGYEFAYSQAPPNMKNVVAGIWFVVTACGTLVMTGLFAIPSIQKHRAATFFAFSGSMVLSAVVFKAITWDYKERKLVSVIDAAPQPLPNNEQPLLSRQASATAV